MVHHIRTRAASKLGGVAPADSAGSGNAADIVVVGAGILGLSTAREFLVRRPGLNVIVLEKERDIARHQTGHNSGVIHSGIYYRPGSLKAQLCVEGGRMLIEFCQAHAIPFERCGKLVVATNKAESERLDDLLERGTANSVPGLEMVGPERMREIEPHARGLRALHSPATAIVDFSEVAKALAGDVTRLGGEIRTGAAVRAITHAGSRIVIRTGQGHVDAGGLVSCAGLYADRLAQMTGGPADPRIIPFRGDYLILRRDRRDLVRGLIYPAPDPALPFLGVHTTRRIDGSIWLGPNAVLAFARTGYRFSTVNPRDLASSLLSPGFWRMARRYWRTSLGEMYRDLNRSAFTREIQRFLPELRAGDVLPGPSGVRAQALGRDGILIDDFVFSTSRRVLHVRNAPSPAATSCLAIARRVVDHFEQVV